MFREWLSLERPRGLRLHQAVNQWAGTRTQWGRLWGILTPEAKSRCQWQRSGARLLATADVLAFGQELRPFKREGKYGSL